MSLEAGVSFVVAGRGPLGIAQSAPASFLDFPGLPSYGSDSRVGERRLGVWDDALHVNCYLSGGCVMMRCVPVFAVVSALFVSTQASAQSCSQVAAEWQSKSATSSIVLYLTTVQKSGLVSTSAYMGGGIHLKWDAAKGRFAEHPCYQSGNSLFNDRYRTDTSMQPFSVETALVDPFTFTFDSALSSGAGTNFRWGEPVSFSTISCANGLIYGWGSGNGLWVFSWTYEPDPYIVIGGCVG